MCNVGRFCFSATYGVEFMWDKMTKKKELLVISIYLKNVYESAY